MKFITRTTIFLAIFTITQFSYSQCTTCTLTDPLVLPNPIPAGVTVCVTTNRVYGGATNLTGGSINICSGANVTFNGAVNIGPSSQITLTGCSSFHVNGNITNANPVGIVVLDNCNCATAVTHTGPLFGFPIVCSPLPVELVSFDAECADGNKVNITWTTASENNNSHFIVERSLDVVNWESVGEVAGAGFSNQEINYSFTDQLPEPGNYYYRLKQVDYDQKSEVFDFEAVTCNFTNVEGSISVFPNPASDVMMVAAPVGVDNYKLEVINMSGMVMKSVYVASTESGNYRMDINDLTDGMYIVKISSDNYTESTKLIVN